MKNLIYILSLIFISTSLKATSVDNNFNPFGFAEPVGLSEETKELFGFDQNTIPLIDLDFGGLPDIFHVTPMGGVSSGGRLGSNPEGGVSSGGLFAPNSSVVIQLDVSSKAVSNDEFDFIVDALSFLDESGLVNKLYFKVWVEAVTFCVDFKDYRDSVWFNYELNTIVSDTIKAKEVPNCNTHTIKPF